MNNAQLPDFLEALETERAKSTFSTDSSPSKSTPSRSLNPTPSPGPLTSRKLRYAAYEPPKQVGRLRHPSDVRRSSSRSTTFSDAGYELELSRMNSTLSDASRERHSLDHLSKTVTAGDLALAGGDIKLDILTKVRYSAVLEVAHLVNVCRHLQLPRVSLPQI